MSLSDWCEHDFGTKSFYGILGVKETATTKEIQQAYRKMSFYLLPAQAPRHRLEEFCRKFETVTKVYYVLSDEAKRQVYDEKGEFDPYVDKLGGLYATRYWKKLFPHIVPEDIEDFKERYIYSKEEKEDLKNAYLLAKGNMDRLAEIYFAYTAEEEERIFAVLKDLIKRKKIPSYSIFVTESPESVQSRKDLYKLPEKEDVYDDKTCMNSIAMFLRQSRREMEEARARRNAEQREREGPPHRRRRH